MRSGIAKLLLLAACLTVLSVPAPAADFYRGLDAYERGDYEAALREWRPLAEEGDAESQYRIARMYYRGEGIQDDAEAARWYRAAAKGGHPVSQNNLGLMYEQGRGVERDLGEAARWYREAADQGVTSAQANLARLYDEGQGLTEDPEKAALWYRRAAKGGHEDSQFRLGQMVPQDADKALKWYRKAANNGSDEAREELATRTTVTPSKKLDPPPDPAVVPDEPAAESEVPPVPDEPAADETPEDLRELRDLAKQGDVEAQYRLARIYMRGDGVPRNLDEAGLWLREAAENGHEMAGYRVAFMYLRAIGVSKKKDYVQAYRWFDISARRGIGDAADWRDKIVGKMSAAELAEAETLVREWTEE